MTTTNYTLAFNSRAMDREMFKKEWQAIEPAVRAVPGINVVYVGRFGVKVVADDKARDALRAALPQQWEIVPPAPPAILCSQSPKP